MQSIDSRNSTGTSAPSAYNSSTSDVDVSVLLLCSLIILVGFFGLVKSSRIFWRFIYAFDRVPQRRIPDTPLLSATELRKIEKIYVIVIHPDDKVQLGISS